MAYLIKFCFYTQEIHRKYLTDVIWMNLYKLNVSSFTKEKTNQKLQWKYQIMQAEKNVSVAMSVKVNKPNVMIH